MNSRVLGILTVGIVVLILIGVVVMSSISNSSTGPSVESVEQKGIPLTSLVAEMSKEVFPEQRFFLVDDTMVFVERTGETSDYSFHHVLFDKNKNELCSYSDNVMGPVKQCSDESKKDLFETITKNLDKADLGLGAGRVALVHEKHAPEQ